ncbi:MAG: sulfatase-like hydrolase/transferase [Proteobacteria bacterium]|nr:sulfatase-like hydrolase/transferase [Pseudomonadota bacterium]
MRARSLGIQGWPAVLLSLTACGAPEPVSFESFDRPDVVLVSIDSLRPDHLGSYGYPHPTSPRIDALAAEGVRFENAVSTTSWTLPAHAALFTGLSDTTHGVVFDGQRLDARHTTLAERLKAAGYHTAGFFGGPYLHPTFGLGQGFDVYQSCMTRLPDDLSDDELRHEALGGAETAHRDITGPRTRREVEKWLASLDERPFFLFLHLWDVHYDFIPPERFVDLFDPDYDGALTSANFMKNPAIHPEMSARDYAHLMALYDGEIRFTDEILGQIRDLLDARGRLAHSLVIVTADHGEEFFEHGRKGHRRTLYDEVLRVPLIVRLPGGIGGGHVIADEASLIDVFPTVLALAGLEVPDVVQGRDLSPLLRGEAAPRREILAELRLPKRQLRALRSNREKFIADGRGFRAYFDLESDPREQEPLAPETPGYAAAFERLKATAAEVQHARRRAGIDGATPVAVDPETQRRLEILGYTDFEDPPVENPDSRDAPETETRSTGDRSPD